MPMPAFIPGIELSRLIDAQKLVLDERAKLGDMAREELETYLQRNHRIYLLCKELNGDWPELRVGVPTSRASRLTRLSKSLCRSVASQTFRRA